MRNVLVGVGGGLASVIMFYSAALGGTGFTFVLMPLLPLPTLIAGLGWGLGASLSALISGAAVMTALGSPLAAVGYTLMLGLPAALVAHLLSLVRYDANDTVTHWLPIGRIVVAIALYGAALPILLIALEGGSFDALSPDLTRVFKLFIEQPWVGAEWRTLEAGEIASVIHIWVQLMPAMISFYWTLFFILNVYLAGRVVKASNLLHRPWPDLHWMSYPRLFPIALGLVLAGALVGGSPRVLGVSAFGALFVAFLLQGLSVIHAVAHGRSAGWSIPATYAALAIAGTIVGPLIALLGVGETLFHLRNRIIPIPAALPPGSL